MRRRREVRLRLPRATLAPPKTRLSPEARPAWRSPRLHLAGSRRGERHANGLYPQTRRDSPKPDARYLHTAEPPHHGLLSKGCPFAIPCTRRSLEEFSERLRRRSPTPSESALLSV